MKLAITKREFQNRLGFICLAFFSFYLIDPIQKWIDANLQLNPIGFGVLGIFLTLLFFDF